MKQTFPSTKFHGSAWAGPIIALVLLITSITPASAVIGVLERVSVTNLEAQATGASTYPSISADNCLIAFESTAADLVTGDTNGAISDVFVRNRCTGNTILVSATSGGTSGNGASESPAISADGSFVAFRSAATDLVAVDTNGEADIFIRNLTTNSTTLVSVDSNEAQANNEAYAPSISADGQFVAFFSYATNLVFDGCDCFDVFVRDVVAGTTELISVDSTELQGNDQSMYCSISGDGRYVAFQSNATNLITGDTNGTPDIFVRDRTLGTTVRASVSTSGDQGAGDSGFPSISSTGQFVAFQSSSHAFAPEPDTNSSVDIFVRDIFNNTTVRASLTSGEINRPGDSTQASISANGQYVAFSSLADLITGGAEGSYTHVYVRDLSAGITTRISVDSVGTQGDAASSHPSLSAGGRYLAFQSVATNLVTGDSNVTSDIFYADSINVEDVTAPGITSIQRFDPTGSPTNATTLVFRATFTEAVTGVDAADFTINASPATTATITAMTPFTTSVYDITVSGGDLASYNGAIGLNIPGSVTITDLALNAFVAAEPATDDTYTLDHIVPDVTITSHPPLYTSSNSATFDFSSTDPTATFICSFDNSDYDPCTSGTAYPGLGQNTWTFYVKAVDLAGNITSTPATWTWTIDWTAPYAVSFERYSPSGSSTNADSLVFRVTFDDDVTGVDNGDFATTASGATATLVEAQPNSVFYVTVSGGSLATYNGVVGLTYSALPTITDLAGNSISTALPTGEDYETYTVDNIAPTVTLTSYPPVLTNSASAEFVFSSLDGGTVFTCSQNGTLYTPCTSPVNLTSLSEGPHSFYVRATDPAGNLGAPTQHNWTVDTLAPTVTITSGPNNPTNLTSATIVFTNSDGTATLTCLLDGSSYTPCASPVTLSGLPTGSHTFTVTATDPAGNPGSDSHTWVIDTTAPNTTINTFPANPTNSTGTNFTFSGTDNLTTPANLDFECKLDAAAFAACTSPVNHTSLSAGSHTFEVRAIDEAGNTDATPATFTWVIDTTAPNTTINTFPANPTNSTGTNFTFSGTDNLTTPANLDFECKLDGAAFAACTSPVNHTSLSAGSHTFEVRAIDEAGNTDATPATFTWVIDTTAPNTTINTFPANPTNSTGTNFTFSGTDNLTTPANLDFECKLDAAAFAACTSPVNHTSLSAGSHTFEVRAIDEAGNADATPATFTWVIDTTAPNTTINTFPANPTNGTGTNFTFSGTDNLTTPANLDFECKLDAAAFAACTSPVNHTSLSAGSHTFEVRAIDEAGNTDATPATFTWVIDTTAPNTTINTFPANPTNSTGTNFTFSGTDNLTTPANLDFECKLDGAAFAACTSPVNHTSLSAGSHTFEVRAIDEAGNTDATPATFTWVIDTTAPNTTINTFPANPTNSTGTNFTFSGTDNLTTPANLDFECKLDAAAFAACTSPVNHTSLSAGSHTFEVHAIDEAGNTDATPATFTWVIDTTAPNTTINTSPAVLTNSPAASFTFSGSDNLTTPANLDFECKLDAAAFAACTSPVNLTSLPAGSHSFSVYAIDEAGNADATPATFTWIIDLTAPDTIIDTHPANPTNATSAAFTFHSTEDLSSFECRLDSSGYSACTSGKSYSSLVEGPHTFYVRATDEAGNTDTTPATYTWTIDLTAPTVTITGHPTNPSNSTTAEFTFTGENVVSFTCSLDGATATTCTSPKEYPSLTAGDHTFNVYGVDSSGNQGGDSFAWTIDLTPPTATSFVRFNPTAELTNANTLVFQVTFSETVTGVASADFAVNSTTTATVTGVTPVSGSVYTVTISGGDLADFNGTVGLNFAASPTIQDTAGNTLPVPASEPGTDETYFVDNEAPTTTIVLHPDLLSPTDSATFTFTGLDNESSTDDLTYECSLDGGAFEDCTNPKTYTTLSIGEHTFSVRAIDELGHVDSTPDTFTWTVAHKIFLPLVRR